MEKKVEMTPEMFKALSVEEKRVVVAQDVIAQILAKRYIPSSGSYIDEIAITEEIKDEEGEAMWGHQLDYYIRDWDIQASFEKIKTCEVCAMGSVILSTTKFENRLKFSDIGSQRSDFTQAADEIVAGIFTPNQLAAMEVMFEGVWMSSSHNYARDRMEAYLSEDIVEEAKEFYEEHKVNEQDEEWGGWRTDHEASSENRLMKIMEGIIDNNGQLIVGGITVI